MIIETTTTSITTRNLPNLDLGAKEKN